MPLNKKYFSITPTNDQPLTSSGAHKVSNGFSHRQGNPTIRLSIPSVEMLLETKSLRLTGQLIVKTANDNTLFNGIPTNFDDGNGANLTKQTSANLPAFGGVHNCFDKIIVQSKKSNTELSNTTNYPTYASLREAYSYNGEDYLWGEVGCMNLSQGGNNAQHSNRRMNISANAHSSHGHLGSQSDKIVGQHFSIPLDIDLFRAGDLHLGANYLNGLNITIHLAPDSAVFNQRWKGAIPANQTLADISEVMYILRNVKLEGRYVNPLPQELKAYQPQKALASVLNLVNDIHSDDNSIQYTPQINMTKSLVSVFMDDDQTNNIQQAQVDFRNPVGIKQIEQSRDNMRFPFSYPIKVSPNVLTTPEGQGALDMTKITNKSDMVGDAEVRLMFEKALLGRKAVKNTQNLGQIEASLENEYLLLSSADANDASVSNMRPSMCGTGCDYTYGVANTLSYMNRDYGLNVKSGVQSGDNNLPADRKLKSELVQTFVKHTSILDTQKLVKVM
tara:strand:+ start:1070 stop:2578 length:1509 start_codon:yes stop_codon:yes gene_type:complete